MRIRPAFACLALAFLGAIAFPPPRASAAIADEQALAERYAPVVRIVAQDEECGPGESYQPMDVDALFGQRTVALRGPWNAADLVKIAPTAKDLAGLYEYHLDFPGNALDPGCGYERWSRLITRGKPSTVYAHVAADSEHPGKLALQYWFFYAFNDFNNLHEGDWELIQLDFDARSARRALDVPPVQIGYSSHEGAERAAWGEGKLELVDGTHPVVYPAAGSHANKFTEALYLGNSAQAGIGCDDTRGPHLELRPAVKVIPSDPASAAREFPWITFEGRWGELQKAFFNGPTGPNLKSQWAHPIEWSSRWRERSYAVPSAGLLGTGATRFFCGAVATGSKGLVRTLRSPTLMLIPLAVLLGLVALAVTGTRWRPAAPLRVGHRRAWGQILAAAARMYARHPGLFIGIGLLLIPLAGLTALAHTLVFGGFGLLGVDTTGESAGAFALVVVVAATLLGLVGLALVQAATARALAELDAGRRIGAVQAYRLALTRAGPLLRGLSLAVVAWVLLDATGFLLPVAIWLVVRWTLLAQVVELERCSGIGGLRRSAALVRGRWFRVASLVAAGAVITIAVGPLLGALLIFAVPGAPLSVLDLVAGVVYALAMPFVALTTTYVYADALARVASAPSESRTLPAEVELGRVAT